ncbi:hypothetical protein, partial [Escherichia coli]|uniref:hypothetical protein n=1 Tax=Escherichia coli TaxID=562 RepID=UPI001BE48C55
WKGWAILLRQKQKKLIMLPSETMIWQPEFTDKTLSRKPGAVHWYAIKPREIINYDAGIVLIDLHQINVKATSDNTNQQH